MSDTQIFNRLKSEFLTWYEKAKQIPYYFTAKDAGNLKRLILKIEYVGREKHKGEGKEWIVGAFRWILGHLPAWINQTPSIALINSKFNEILANGRNDKKAQLREQFNKNFAQYKTRGNY